MEKSFTRGFVPARLALAVLFPFLAFGLQWVFWSAIRPYIWFLFFPTVFFSSQVGGMAGGLVATALSAVFASFFMEPRFSFLYGNPVSLISVLIFCGMGALFSLTHARLARAKQVAEESLAASHEANARLRAANEEITRLYEKTRELDALKTRFFANVSHELRTPLTLILGPLARRLADCDDAAVRADLLVMERNARLLYRHVSDLLDVAKLDAGRMEMRYTRVDAAQLVRFMASCFESLAREKHIRFSVAAPDVLPAVLDAEKARRILQNLFSNAFKFTPDGGSVDVRLEETGDLVTITVADNGPGVPPAFRQAVFERFRQLDGGEDRRYGGTGLGLAIAREFAVLHGGNILLGAAPDGGASFVVTLPAAAPVGTVVHDAPPELNPVLDAHILEELLPERRRPSPADGPTADAPLVLVIEDNVDMNDYLVGILGCHYRTITATNGREGLEKARALHPDLIVSDVMMPILSGQDMVRELRRDKRMDDVPVVMLTAKADDELRRTLIAERVQDYLVKPFDAGELLARIGRLLTDKGRHTLDLRASERRFQATFELAAVGIALVAPDGRWLRVNRKLCDIVGYSPEEMAGMSFQDVTHPDDLDQDMALVRQVLDGEIATYNKEKRYIRKDGATVWISLTTALVRDAAGAPDYFISVIEDFSQRKAVEEQLRLSKDDLEQAARKATLLASRAEAANLAKSAFLANMSHEIRTPLNGLMGMMQLLKTTELDDEQLEYADMAIRSGGRLTRLLGDILDLSRIEAERLTLYPSLFRLADVFSAITETFAPLVREKGLPLTCQAAPGLPPTLIGDEMRVRQILFNLTGNAMKFTETGQVRVEACLLMAPAPGWVRLLFTVSDTGIGIPDDKIDSIGEPFTQADSSYTRDQQGAGLGLTISRQLTALMGGTLTIESEPGRGTTVYLMLPFALPEDAVVRDTGLDDPAFAQKRGCRVLLVEDDAVNQLAASRLLEKFGCEVVLAGNGVEAVAAVGRERFDCVFMDVQMPIMDGLEATRRIRAGGLTTLPIVAMTAYAMSGDREKILAAGMDDYIAKPVEAAGLAKVLKRALAAGAAAVKAS